MPLSRRAMIASLAGCCCNAVLAGESTSLQTSSTADELEGCLREGTDVNPKSDVNNIIHSRADETSYRESLALLAQPTILNST